MRKAEVESHPIAGPGGGARGRNGKPARAGEAKSGSSVRYQRLLRRYPMRIVSIECDADRFLDLFRKTWTRLPRYARRAILNHWRPHGAVVAVEAGVQWSRGERAIATTAFGGAVVRFKPIVDVMPDEAVMELIAHELSHVVQWSTGVMRDYLGANGRDEYTCRVLIEEDADQTVLNWGFDRDALYEWKQRQVGPTQRIPR